MKGIQKGQGEMDLKFAVAQNKIKEHKNER